MGVRRLGTGTPADRKRDQCRESMRRMRVERRMDGMPIGGLKPRERRLVTNLVRGNTSVTKAVTDAGYHAQTRSIKARIRPGGDLARVVQQACQAKGLTVDAVVEARVQALQADKTSGMMVPDDKGQAVLHMIPDHSVRLKASELGERALQAAGEWPVEHAAPGAGGRIRIVQIGADGAQSIIEVES